jgi:catechol 2,3-dioxygenase-like lactoylglutathione lyase family enzyme
MDTVYVRQIVHDVARAVAFYTDHLGFELDGGGARGFAALVRGNLTLLLNEPGAGGAGQAMPDGRAPAPGGWSRIQIRVPDLDDAVDALRRAGVTFRGDVVTGRGGRQVLVEDPSGNPIELFEPAARAPSRGGAP